MISETKKAETSAHPLLIVVTVSGGRLTASERRDVFGPDSLLFFTSSAIPGFRLLQRLKSTEVTRSAQERLSRLGKKRPIQALLDSVEGKVESRRTDT